MGTKRCLPHFKGKRAYRVLSWSHDAWALIALIALLSAILVLGNIWGFGTFDACKSRSEGTSKNHFLQMLVMC